MALKTIIAKGTYAVQRALYLAGGNQSKPVSQTTIHAFKIFHRMTTVRGSGVRGFYPFFS
jgi:hypothetical protein